MNEDVLRGDSRIIIEYRLRSCPPGSWLRWLVPNDTLADRKRTADEWEGMLRRQWGSELEESRSMKVTSESLEPRYR